MRYRLAGLFTLLLLLPAALCGCWDKQELGEIAIVLGAGFDTDAAGGVTLSVELAHGKSGEEEGESMVFTASGDTREAAAAALEQKLDKSLFWGNLALIVFSDALTETQTTGLALAMYQDGRMNSATPLLRAEGKAADVLAGSFGEAAYVSQGLAQALERNAAGTDEVYTLAAHLELLLGSAALRAMPVVTIAEDGEVFLGDGGNGA